MFRTSDNLSTCEVEEALCGLGYSVCGAGVASTVYAGDDPNTVVKICPSYDSGYLEFINWTFTEEGRKYSHWFPVVHSRSRGEDHECFILEKLIPLSSLSEDEQLRIKIKLGVNSTGSLIDYWPVRDRFKHLVDIKLNRVHARPNLASARVAPELDVVLQALVGAVFRKGMTPDMHDENIMARRVGDEILPVIIDPFS